MVGRDEDFKVSDKIGIIIDDKEEIRENFKELKLADGLRLRSN